MTRYGQGRPQGRSLLRLGQGYTSYGSVGPISGSCGRQSPPPYSAIPGLSGEEYQEIHASHCQQGASPLRPAVITKGRIAVTAVFLAIVAQLAAFVFFYDLPAKVSRYAEVMARMRVREEAMREEAKHLESERTALREEREKWEKAHEDRVPPGAFWEIVQPSPDCLSYGKREYWGIIRNIPKGWTDLDACMNTPTEIKGVSVRRPNRCLYVGDSPHIHGFWTVDWNQLDCKPWHRDFDDRVSLRRSGQVHPPVELNSQTLVPRVVRIRGLALVGLKPGSWVSTKKETRTGDCYVKARP